MTLKLNNFKNIDFFKTKIILENCIKKEPETKVSLKSGAITESNKVHD